jgi:hypothetical protein
MTYWLEFWLEVPMQVLSHYLGPKRVRLALI